MDRWEVIGSGQYGQVYKTCYKDNAVCCDYVLKQQDYDKDVFNNEIKAIQILKCNPNLYDHIPTLYDAWICFRAVAVPAGMKPVEPVKGQAYYVMEELIPLTAGVNYYEQVSEILNEMQALGWLHVDIKPDNVMQRVDGTVVIIDFGWCVNMTDGIDIDGVICFPNHPLSVKFDKCLTWVQLAQFQLVNLRMGFNAPVELQNRAIELHRTELYPIINPEQDA